MTAIWGHRGAPDMAPENTLAAFAAAVELGADGVEFDVRATADGAPAILHDPFLPDGRLVAAVAAADLPAAVPLLDAALDACGPLVVNIEIKESMAMADVVVAEVRNRGITGRVVVSSFDVEVIDRVRLLDGAVPTGVLATFAATRARATRLVELCRQRGHVAVHPFHRGVDLRLVDLAHANGLAVNTWTVDDPRRITRLATMGVDAIVTNRITLARTVLGR